MNPLCIVGFLFITITASSAEKELLSQIPVQHHKHSSTPGSDKPLVQVPPPEGSAIGHDAAYSQKSIDKSGKVEVNAIHDDFEAGDSDTRPQLPVEKLDYMEDFIFNNGDNLVNMVFRDELLNGQDVDKRRIGSAKNVKYKTWKYRNNNKWNRIRNNNRIRRSNSGILEDDVNIGQARAKRDSGELTDDQDSLSYWDAVNLLNSRTEQTYPLSAESYKYESKRPMGMGPIVSWGQFFDNKSKRPMGMGPSSNWAKYFHKRSDDELLKANKRPMGIGPLNNWAKYFGDSYDDISKRPMGMGPSMNWAGYFEKKSSDDFKQENKRPMNMGPSINWARYFNKRGAVDLKKEYKRPMAITPYVDWSRYVYKRDGLKEDEKRPMGMGPTSTWASYFNKRSDDDFKEESKRPIGMGPYMNWARYYKRGVENNPGDDFKPMIYKRPMGMGPYINWARYYKRGVSKDFKWDVKRPMGMGPNVNWAQFYHKRDAPTDDDISASKRPMGMGPINNWGQYYLYNSDNM